MGMEGACPGRATPTNWRCGRAARQLSAPHPGHTQTLPSGNHFCARHGGGQSQGLWRLQRPRRGCGRSLWPAHEMRGHFSHKPRCRGPCHLAASRRRTKSVHEGDARAERCGQRTRDMRGCSCAERACAWSRRACAEACPLRLGRTRLPRRASFAQPLLPASYLAPRLPAPEWAAERPRALPERSWPSYRSIQLTWSLCAALHRRIRRREPSTCALPAPPVASARRTC